MTVTLWAWVVATGTALGRLCRTVEVLVAVGVTSMLVVTTKVPSETSAAVPVVPSVRVNSVVR